MAHTIVCTDTPNLDPDAFRRRFPEARLEFVEPGSADSLVDAPEADAIVADVTTPITAAVLDAHPDLAIAARAGTGIDNVDVAAAAERGVPVTNVVGYCTAEVATHALSLLVSARRYLVGHDRRIRDGEWDWSTNAPAPRLAESTLGIVSFGVIARRFAELAAGLEFDRLVYDPYVDQETVDAHDATLVDFETLLERSDAVAIFAPLTEETRGLFDAEAFERMRDHAVLVNVGRGGIVDEADLAAALEAGELDGAGLDVFEREPPTESPVVGRDDVICTPHSAWYSEDAKATLNETLLTNIAAAFAGETPPARVDPEADWL